MRYDVNFASRAASPRVAVAAVSSARASGISVGAAIVSLVETRFAKNSAEAVACADALGYPVALKIEAREILHKTEAGGVLLQGFVEEYNVNPIAEVSRMIEVQRAYEMGQGLLDREDDRVRSVIRTLGR